MFYVLGGQLLNISYHILGRSASKIVARRAALVVQIRY